MSSTPFPPIFSAANSAWEGIIMNNRPGSQLPPPSPSSPSPFAALQQQQHQPRQEPSRASSSTSTTSSSSLSHPPQRIHLIPVPLSNPADDSARMKGKGGRVTVELVTGEPEGAAGGETFKFGSLGPTVVNSDGSFSQIEGWEGLTTDEQERTTKLLMKKKNVIRTSIERPSRSSSPSSSPSSSSSSKQPNPSSPSAPNPKSSTPSSGKAVPPFFPYVQPDIEARPPTVKQTMDRADHTPQDPKAKHAVADLKKFGTTVDPHRGNQESTRGIEEKIVDLMKDAELQEKHTQAKDAEGEQGDGVHLVRLHGGVVDGGLDG